MVGPLLETMNDLPIVGLIMNNLEAPSSLIKKKIKPKTERKCSFLAICLVLAISYRNRERKL
uniref:Uncharacterized protein n=1 Tax=Nelumbo nucifera TaxID=4432 RepID=A0A822ZA17_NELNU|nr:TPA_asm: hypothetical protein HUJ06_014864 [Nelumbo nucifera]